MGAKEELWPKCSGKMCVGFMLDKGDGNRRYQSLWVEGEPEPSFWTGLSISSRRQFLTRAMRCSTCGFLEFYATVENQ